jgi:uncharacterized protein (TIGR00369 family)
MPNERLSGFVELLGLREVAVRPGTVRVDLEITSSHRNIQGVTHGSVTMALMDTAMGHALSGTLAAAEFCSTTQISFQFLKASRPGDRLTATGHVVRRGSRIAYLEGSCVNQDGDEVARAQGTWYVGRLDEKKAPPGPVPAARSKGGKPS